MTAWKTTKPCRHTRTTVSRATGTSDGAAHTASTGHGHLRTVEELEQVVRRGARLLGAPTTAEGEHEIARRSRGTPRIAGRLLRRVRDFAHAAGSQAIDDEVADRALTRLEIDRLGLDAMDRRYLTMIADLYGGGPVGVETLAAGLSEPRDTLEDVVEPFLIQLGLIARTARGRCLNGRGWQRGERRPPAASRACSIGANNVLVACCVAVRCQGLGGSPAPTMASLRAGFAGRSDICSTRRSPTALNPNGYGSTGLSPVAKSLRSTVSTFTRP
jgi:hypothetical protein